MKNVLDTNICIKFVKSWVCNKLFNDCMEITVKKFNSILHKIGIKTETF